jgi:ribosome-binding protein aMBF1 (putative translation factor)
VRDDLLSQAGHTVKRNDFPQPALHNAAASITLSVAKPKEKAKTQMDFGERLAALRKEKGLTQQALAELINLHVIQVRRYESGPHSQHLM